MLVWVFALLTISSIECLSVFRFLRFPFCLSACLLVSCFECSRCKQRKNGKKTCRKLLPLPRVLLPSCFMLPHRANTRRDTKGTHAATQDEHWKRPPHNLCHQNLFCGLASARSIQSSGFCSSSWLPSGSSMSLAHVCLWYSQSFF